MIQINIASLRIRLRDSGQVSRCFERVGGTPSGAQEFFEPERSFGKLLGYGSDPNEFGRQIPLCKHTISVLANGIHYCFSSQAGVTCRVSL